MTPPPFFAAPFRVWRYGGSDIDKSPRRRGRGRCGPKVAHVRVGGARGGRAPTRASRESTGSPPRPRPWISEPMKAPPLTEVAARERRDGKLERCRATAP